MSKGIDISALPRPVQWAIVIFFIALCIFVMKKFTEETAEISGEDSYAHNASKEGVESLEILKEGAETARDIDGVLSEKR